MTCSIMVVFQNHSFNYVYSLFQPRFKITNFLLNIRRLFHSTKILNCSALKDYELHSFPVPVGHLISLDKIGLRATEFLYKFDILLLNIRRGSPKDFSSIFGEITHFQKYFIFRKRFRKCFNCGIATILCGNSCSLYIAETRRKVKIHYSASSVLLYHLCFSSRRAKAEHYWMKEVGGSDLSISNMSSP